MFIRLMLTRRFAPMFWCQFFSAFNDNFVKTVLVIVVLFKLSGAHAGMLVTLASAFLVLPFFLFSGIGGQLADRYDKALVARRIKAAEIAIALTAAIGFYMHVVPVMYAALFGMGTIAALFGPIKYGILPDHLERHELPGANALIEAATFLAILTGTIAGGIAWHALGDGPAATAILLIAVLCWLCSLAIPPTPEAAPTLRIDLNIIRSTRDLLRQLGRDRRLRQLALAISWFWATGIVVLSLAPTLVKNTLNGSETVVTAMLALFSVGIAIGSALAAVIARGRIIVWPVPLAAAAIGVFGIDLSLAGNAMAPSPEALHLTAFFSNAEGMRIAAGFTGLAVAAGLFAVPLFAAVQAWSPAEGRARIVAAINVLNALFMALGTLVTAALQAAGARPALLLGVLGALNMVAAVLIFLSFRSFTSGDDKQPTADEARSSGSHRI